MVLSEISEFLPNRRNWQNWLAGFAVWTILALLTASRNYLTYAQLNLEVPWRITLLSAFVDYYLWGLASIGIFGLARRFPLEQPRLLANLLIQFGGGVLFTLAVAVVSIPIFIFLNKPGSLPLPSTDEFFHNIVFRPANLYQGFITFWATVAVAHAINYYRISREKELGLQKLAVQLAEAKLRALKMQIHPHFLFNTLNSISALLNRHPEKAEQMIAYLGEFLRLTLTEPDGNQTQLKKEIHFLETYLKIEKIRFRDRLKVDFLIEPDVFNAAVPTLIMQPLVENAIKHGFADRSENCLLEISAARSNGSLFLTVKDNGAGFGARNNEIVSNGLGLKNTKQRLAEIYGNDFRFDIKSPNGNGTTVEIEMPFIDFLETKASENWQNGKIESFNRR